MNLHKLFCVFVLCLASCAAFGQSGPVTANLTASAATCTPSLPGTACLILQIGGSTNTVAATLGGTFSGTLQFEGSGDNASTWVSVAATPSSGGSSVTSATGTGTWQIQSGGYTYLRIRCSTYSSGTVTATLNPSKAATTSSSSGSGSGTVSANSGSVGAVANYAAAGGSTTVGPDTLLTDNGTTLTYSGTGGVSSPVFISTVATGTAPLTVTSTTVVGNLTATSLGVSGRNFAATGALGGITTMTLSGGGLLCSSTAPTVASGFSGTAPTLTANGSCAFSILINATPGSTGTLTFPAATHGWHVSCDDITTQSATVFRTQQTGAVSTTSVILTQLTDAGATGTAWNLSDVLACSASAY